MKIENLRVGNLYKVSQVTADGTFSELEDENIICLNYGDNCHYKEVKTGVIRMSGEYGLIPGNYYLEKLSFTPVEELLDRANFKRGNISKRKLLKLIDKYGLSS